MRYEGGDLILDVDEVRLLSIVAMREVLARHEARELMLILETSRSELQNYLDSVVMRQADTERRELQKDILDLCIGSFGDIIEEGYAVASAAGVSLSAH